MQNEYIGNLIYPRFRNKKLGLKHRHDKIGEILNENLDHPILKKIYNWMHPNNLNRVRSVVDMSNPQMDYKYLPIRGKITDASKLSSKQIRSALTNNPKPIPKIIENPSSEQLSHLGRLLKNLTNVKLKGIILRAIHGDIYSGTRLKKFGMSDTDSCPRCGVPETVQHQIFECEYTRKIWNYTTKITGIKIRTINDVLGHNELHDKLTLTLHAEIIRILLSIERPDQDQLSIIKNTIKRLIIVERCISKFQLEKMLKVLENIT